MTLTEASFTGFPFPTADDFSPVPLSGLVVWLDANRGLALDGDSQRVAGWSSRVGALSALQGTTAAMPILVASALNGRAGVRCDGADDFLEATMPAGLGTLGTVYVVVSGLDGSGNFRTLLSTPGWRLETNNIQLAPSGGFGFSPFAGAHVLDAIFGDGSYPSTVWVDGAVVGATGTGTSVSPSTLEIGKNVAVGGADYGNMTFHEILYYSAAPSLNDQGRIRAYLAAKWGLA